MTTADDPAARAWGAGALRFTQWSELAPSRSDRLAKTRFTGVWIAGRVDACAGSANVAVVGPRAPSEAARARAHALAEALARSGVCTVSGLALGVDAAAHAGALAGGGRTVGVLGGGHGHFFPPRNLELGRSLVARGGAVLSPYPPAEPARPWQFLARNGIVAALCDAVVVVEAASRSGALNTAGWAGELGVEVLAYPGDVERPKAAGCNALIRDGATLVRGPDDVLEALGLLNSAAEGRNRDPTAMATASLHEAELARFTTLERQLIGRLAAGPADFETLLSGAGTVADVAAALVTLEIGGVLRREAANAIYALTPRVAAPGSGG